MSKAKLRESRLIIIILMSKARIRDQRFSFKAAISELMSRENLNISIIELVSDCVLHHIINFNACTNENEKSIKLIITFG